MKMSLSTCNMQKMTRLNRLMFSIICLLLVAVVHCTSGKCPTIASWNNLQATVTALKRELRKTNSVIADLKTELHDRISNSVNLVNPTEVSNGIPKSCADLRRMGHIWSGMYSIMDNKQMQSVFCDFSKETEEPKFQTKIGYVEVKTSPVYFYVQRSSSFSMINVPIPFELERLNVGGAMNITSGIFTAPRAGTYSFSFSGIAYSNNLYITMYVNDSRIGSGNSKTALHTLALQSTIHLKAGDKVTLQLFNGPGTLYDDASRYTHFTGSLLQEEFAY